MENVTLVVGNLPSSRNARMVVLLDSSNAGKNAAYLYYTDKNLAHWFKFDESGPPKFVEIRTLVFPSPILEIFSLASYRWVLLEDGCIYKIPEGVCMGDALASLSKASNFSANCNSQTDLVWPKATSIPRSCKVFQNKNIRSICTLREMAFMLFAGQLHWSVNLYKFETSTLNQQSLVHIRDVVLPHVIKKPFKPCMASFLLGDGNEENEIDYELCKCIFGGKLPPDCEGVILVTISDGELFVIPVVDDVLRDISAFPLFSCREPVVKIQKILVKIDNSKDEVGILFVGVSGKLSVLSRSHTQAQEPRITEFHVPGPIHLWSGCGGIAFHTDGVSSLWKTIFKKQNSLDEDSSIIAMSTMECIRASGICLFNNKEESPQCLIYAENGNLIFIKNCSQSSFIPPEFFSTLKPMDLKQLLTEIHECSEHLLKIYLEQESKKRILSELSCAAHLILNDKVRKMFKVAVLPEWMSDDPSQILIAMKLANEADFNLVGNHWHFLFTVTTASGRCLTKSVPLNGLQTGQKVIAKIKINVGDIVTDNDLPFTVTAGLQLFLDVNQDSLMELHLENSGYQKPVSFFVKLLDALLNELYFLSASIGAQLMHNDPCITNALWELARCRPAIIFHDLENFPKVSSKLLETSIFNFVTVKKSIIERIMKSQRFPEGPLLVSLLIFIISDSKIVLPSEVSDVELFMFGHKVKLVLREDDIYVQIKIIVWCPSLLSKLRFAILQKLQLKDYEISEATMSKPNQIEGFILKPAVFKSCLALNSRLLQLSSLKQENQNNLVSHFYAEMREIVSSELPFV